MTWSYGFRLVLVLSSCAASVKPKKVAYYDEMCDIVAQKLVLEYDIEKAIPNGRDCEDERCVMNEVAKIGKTISETIVVGSLVVAGNTIYWFEKQGSCLVSKSGSEGEIESTPSKVTSAGKS
ncbi:MAG: hypothetical protein GY776_13365 [Alteromonas sp.]|nr:hypothetical protein [Alteromonas sp.]